MLLEEYLLLFDYAASTPEKQKNHVHQVRGLASVLFIKKNRNASSPSGHPLVSGKNVKTFRWDHRMQIRLIRHEVVPRG